MSPVSEMKTSTRATTLDKRSNLMFVILVGCAMTAGVSLRWIGLSARSFWFDEGYSLWISRLSVREIWQVLPMDTSSPLYYVLLHYWMKCFGGTEYSIRALSAFFGTISIALFYLLARKILVDRWPVGLAVTIYAVSSLQIWYAQEARCYAVLVFLSLASIYCLLHWLEACTLFRTCFLVLLITASLYTHNMALSYLPGLLAMWLIYPAEINRRERLKGASLVFASVLILYLPWLPTLHGQLQRVHGNFWLTRPGARDLIGSLCLLSGFDTRTLQGIFRGGFHASRLFGFWTWGPAVLLIFLGCLFGGLYNVRAEDRRKIAALLSYSLIPLFVVFIASYIFSPIYTDRVFLGSCAVLPILYCAPVALQGGNYKRGFQVVALLVLFVTAVSSFGYLRNHQKEDWRGVTEYLLKVPEKRRLSVIVPDMAQVLVQYYATGLFKSYPSIAVTGLLTRFEPPDPDLEVRTLKPIDENADVLLALSQVIASTQSNEVDVVVQPGTLPALINPTLQYLTVHCGRVDIVEFYGLEVRRCYLKRTSQQ